MNQHLAFIGTILLLCFGAYQLQVLGVGFLVDVVMFGCFCTLFYYRTKDRKEMEAAKKVMGQMVGTLEKLADRVNSTRNISHEEFNELVQRTADEIFDRKMN